MAAPKLSTQDKKDLDKFAKYLVYKCIQIIVQSRLGEKIHTHSKTFSSGSDWFNLGIGDIPEVKAETVKIFNGSLSLGQNVCVEISLKTAEGETMILETWWLTLTEQCDPGARVSYTVYNRMGTLLKSLFSISRSTPSYRLSRKQGPETFVICYRLYMGEPQMSHLGEGFSKSKIGGVPTPVGTFTLSVAFRTKMLISPHTSTKDLCEDLQENHFNNESSPKKVNESRPCIITRRERKFSGDDHGLMFGDPQDICATTFTNSPSDPRIYTTAYGTPPSIHKKPSLDQGSSVDENNKENIPRSDNAPCPSVGPRVCAFAPHLTLGNGRPDEDEADEDEDEDIPFSSLLRPRCPHSPGGSIGGGRYSSGSSQDERMSETITQSAGSSSTNNTRSTQSAHSHGSQSAPDDFVMVELKTPFAGPEGNSDLGRFYHDFQGAPALTMFKNSVTVEDTLNSITDQLSVFDSKSKDFDDFIKNLQTSEG